jgi:ferredoxin-NADP reductase
MPQKLRCKVTDVVDHGERVYSISLKPDLPAPRFLPGQFLHLALDSYNPGDFWPESRVFSIASAPAERNLLRITYAVKGQFTSNMESELIAGREVWLKLPYGEFIVSSDSDACLLAGGTGITAFTSFLTGLPVDYPRQVYLFYGARKPELLLYRSLALSAAQRCPNLHVKFFIEQLHADDDCLPGRIDLDIVQKSIVDPLSVNYYLAGPPEMLHFFLQRLRQFGIASNQITIDAWE